MKKINNNHHLIHRKEMYFQGKKNPHFLKY